jgi:hypothetical protein
VPEPLRGSLLSGDVSGRANWGRPYRVSNIPTIKTKGRIAPPKMAIHV